MENYRDIAMKYVKCNKRRNILTICGVGVSVMVLYIILNLGWSYLLNYRSELRKDRDYEIVLLTETREQIDGIIAEDVVKDATVGRYYYPDYENPKDYENATYINIQNPYRMEKTLDYLTGKYQVEGELNGALAPTYLQGSTADVAYIIILIVILVSYICAIFGVGIIRNSIQLTLFEQIKDFGNLRCIGATKGQLRSIIYIQGAILELSGIVLGVLFGWIGSLIAGAFLKWDHTGFHFAPLPFIVVAFMFDLFFAMNENAKLVTGMTPVSAIRGEFRIKKERFKRRKKSLWGLIFGVEGDYAYKNVRRHSGRFVRTVTAMSLGIAATMLIFGISRSFAKVILDMDRIYGYYHVYFMSPPRPYDSKEEMMKNLPPTDILSQASALPGLGEAKRMYANGAIVADFDKHLAHFTQEYKDTEPIESYLRIYKEHEQEIKAGGESDMLLGSFFMDVCNIPCYGYDKVDMERYKDKLIAGTVDVSDHGVVLVNGGYSQQYDEENDRFYVDSVEYTDYKVGDEIEFVDAEVFRKRYEEAARPLDDDYEAHHKEQQAKYDAYDENASDLTNEQLTEKNNLYKKMQNEEIEYHKKRYNLLCAVYNQVLEEGHTVTYVIEGIVKKDANFGMDMANMSIVMPLDNYYELTGTDETWSNGMMYHFDHFPVNEYMNRFQIDYDEAVNYFSSGYGEYMSLIDSFRNVFIVAGMIILFVVVISIFNIINTTASDLYLRRKELAQLRVLGVSKKELYKMVILEGIIQAILSAIIGIILGTGLGFGFFELVFGIWFGYHYVFPVAAMLLAVVATVLILCGAVYFPLKRLPNDVAAELATAGE